jgi:hypothetical protein
VETVEAPTVNARPNQGNGYVHLYWLVPYLDSGAVFQASPVSMRHTHGLNSYVEKLINGAICVEGVVGTGCPLSALTKRVV